jgi:hypothetical protein
MCVCVCNATTFVHIIYYHPEHNQVFTHSLHQVQGNDDNNNNNTTLTQPGLHSFPARSPGQPHDYLGQGVQPGIHPSIPTSPRPPSLLSLGPMTAATRLGMHVSSCSYDMHVSSSPLPRGWACLFTRREGGKRRQ